MSRIVFAIIAAMVAASPAVAHCYTVPDDATSHYVNRSVGRTICLEDELSAAQKHKQLQTSIETQITNMQQQLQQQQFDQMMQSKAF